MNLGPADIARLASDSGRRNYWTRAKTMVTWMDGAVRSVVRVAAGETDPDQVDLFWIRLYGVAVDVRDDILRLEKEMRTFFPQYPRQGHRGRTGG